MQHPFAALKAEYEHDISIMRVTRLGAVDEVARRLTRPQVLARYDEVKAKLGIPDVVQATICERESGSDFSRSPAQGDRWDRVSVNVPRGRGPFSSWLESAVDAFHNVDHLDDNSAPWSLPYACWKWEIYNGFGYRAHGRRSPYVVGGTNLQQPGKYTSDGHFDPGTMDTQLGCLPVAVRMIELVPALAFGDAIAIVSAPSVVPAPSPPPAGTGGAVTGVKWIQDSLNRLMAPDEDLLVVDGSYGRRTREAVRAFQAAHGLLADGLAGDLTTAAMDAELAKRT